MRGGVLIFAVGIWLIFGAMYIFAALGHRLPLPLPPAWIGGYACLAYASTLVMGRRDEE